MSLLLNICKFNKCGLVFPNLNQLIQHIEREHLNFDAEYLEKLEKAKPAALPLSYVLPSNIELLENSESDEEHERPSSSTLTDSEPRNLTLFPFSDEISNISKSADANSEDEIDAEDTFTFDFIMRYGSKRSINHFDEKPYICPMPGCTKRYKNVNGLRYHARNGHKKNIKPDKKYECYCGRGYKTAQGLRAHTIGSHGTANILPSTSSLPQAEGTSSLFMLANMPNDTFAEIHDLNTLKELGVDAEFDLTVEPTDNTCLEAPLDAKLIKEEPQLNLDCTDSVSELKRIKLEHDENSSNCSSSVCVGTSDADKRTNRLDLDIIKSEPLDDDEIDVGNVHDTCFPFYN